MRAAPILAWTLVLSACALFGAPPKAPQLSIVKVDSVKSDFWEQRLKVRMRVQNPNDRTLAVKGLSYTLEVDGLQCATGVSGASFVVPALGEAEFDMNVTANVAGTLFKLLQHGGERQEIPYRITGRVSLSEGLLRSVPFDERGTLKWP